MSLLTPIAANISNTILSETLSAIPSHAEIPFLSTPVSLAVDDKS